MTWIINEDWVHGKLRDCGWLGRGVKRLHLERIIPLPKTVCWGITKRSSRPNEWYEAFYDATNYFVVLHLKDERRIYGWANLYPDLATEGHILMRDAIWPDNEPKPDLPERPIMNILVDVTDVRFVEFLAALPEKTNVESATAESGSPRVNKEGRRESEADGPPAAASSATTGTEKVE